MKNIYKAIMVALLWTIPSVFAGQSLDARISLGNGTRISEGGPNTISFSGLKSIGTNIVAYNWQLDEGEIITGETVSYEFSRPDNDDIWTYMLSLEIENAAGNQTTSYMQIEVGQNSLRYKPYQEKSKKQFYLADHLGNVRATVDDAAEIASQDAYYPFGKRMPNLSSEYADGEARYKYNGKELDDENGLNWLAYGARYYDSEIGRWHVIDFLAEKYRNVSPYHFVKNNAINRIDPDGNEDYEIDQDGNINIFPNDAEDNIFILDANGERGKSLTFEYGTIMDVSSEKLTLLDSQSEDGTKTKDYPMQIMKINGADNARAIFDFLADPENTRVEWTIAEYIENGENTHSVGTGHMTDRTPVGAFLLDE
jgi:RHS repeat-associated protein